MSDEIAKAAGRYRTAIIATPDAAGEAISYA